MNENAKSWVAALRSGKFTQGQGALRVDDDRCCLGVACDLYAEQNPKATWSATEDQREQTFIVTHSDANDTVLPDAVAKWLGFSYLDFTGGLPDEAPYGNLPEANDHGDQTFADIADLIEEHADYLFRQETA